MKDKKIQVCRPGKMSIKNEKRRCPLKHVPLKQIVNVLIWFPGSLPGN
jgi:hypothetical protein